MIQDSKICPFNAEFAEFTSGEELCDTKGILSDELLEHMFLAYVEKNIVFIQESGSGISNVNVGTQSKSSLNTTYRYKRNLDGWYGDGK